MKKFYLLPAKISENGIGDIPSRTRESARKCTLFIVERAKSARAYLKELGADIHSVKIIEMTREFIKHRRERESFLNQLESAVHGHKHIAVLSESGTPGIADPGQRIAAMAHRKGWQVVPLIGPNSVLLALMASGLNGQTFKFCGYLPKDPYNRPGEIKRYERESSKNFQTQIFIETVYRNIWLFDDIINSCKSDTKFSVAVDLTGENEQIFQMSISEWKGLAKSDIKNIRDKLNEKPAIFLILASKR